MPKKLSEVLGKPVTIELGGRTFTASPLDLNDLSDLEERFGSVGLIDTDSIKGIRFLLWLVLRKADPELSDEDREEERWKLTEKQVGRMVTMQDLSNGSEVVTQILSLSGFGKVEGDDSGNEAETGEEN